ncbi:hypothetical protein GF325_09170 [Candidatus Bathyarchaeota archaeon]|nr:hypothetical protein [Candidatus Bathyarchaeota archaeon]
MRCDFNEGSYSVITLTSHHACCVNHRRKLFDTGDIITQLKEINIEVSKRYDWVCSTRKQVWITRMCW